MYKNHEISENFETSFNNTSILMMFFMIEKGESRPIGIGQCNSASTNVLIRALLQVHDSARRRL